MLTAFIGFRMKIFGARKEVHKLPDHPSYNTIFRLYLFLTIARQINCRLLNFSSASIYKVLQCRSKLVKIMPEFQTAWIWMRRRVTQRLIQIQAVCIWTVSC